MRLYWGKWRWSLFHQEGSLWSEVLIPKYDGWKGLVREGELLRESLWWKDLKKICGGNSREKWFDEGIEWKTGQGEKIRFWLDEWIDGNWLANFFLDCTLFRIKKRMWFVRWVVGGWIDGFGS